MEANLSQLMMRRLTFTGSTLRPQSDLAKARIAESLRREVWPLLDAGVVAPVMDEEFALEDAAKAHARMEAGAHIGKIVLRVCKRGCDKTWRPRAMRGRFCTVTLRDVWVTGAQFKLMVWRSADEGPRAGQARDRL